MIVLLDENATADHEAALVEVFTGKAGGPVADVPALGTSLNISDRNAVQGDFLFEHAA